MSSRKILILLNNETNLQGCTNFIVRLFSGSKTLIVIGFVEESPVTQHQQQQIITELQKAFGLYPDLKLVARSMHKLSNEDIRREAKYTDLIVLPATSFSEVGNHWLPWFQEFQNQVTKDVPVMVVPNTEQQIDEVLITYDGIERNFSAIKQ